MASLSRCLVPSASGRLKEEASAFQEPQECPWSHYLHWPMAVDAQDLQAEKVLIPADQVRHLSLQRRRRDRLVLGILRDDGRLLVFPLDHFCPALHPGASRARTG